MYSEATNTVNGKKCAVKKNKGVFDHITDARRILREIKLLMHFNHQDIISMIDVIPPDSTDIDTFNDVYLVMPKMETTLAKVIRSRQKLSDRHYQFFMYQMCRGCAYMHSANVIHRDLVQSPYSIYCIPTASALSAHYRIERVVC